MNGLPEVLGRLSFCLHVVDVGFPGRLLIGGTSLVLMRERDGCVLADKVTVAYSPLVQLVGLIGHPNLAPGAALLIPKCRQVHTLFMRFAIDIIAIDDTGAVVGVQTELRPYSVSRYFRMASRILELREGIVKSCGIVLGDRLICSDEGFGCSESES